MGIFFKALNSRAAPRRSYARVNGNRGEKSERENEEGSRECFIPSGTRSARESRRLLSVSRWLSYNDSPASRIKAKVRSLSLNRSRVHPDQPGAAFFIDEISACTMFQFGWLLSIGTFDQSRAKILLDGNIEGDDHLSRNL